MSVIRSALVATALLVFTGCVSTGPAEPPITVQGLVSFRGAEPFAAAWLETDMQTFYVLVMDDARGAALMTPAMYRVTGRVYRDSWNGIPMAHLAVDSMQRMDR